MTNKAEKSTIKAASRGDPDAVARLYELYHVAIFRFLYYRTGSQANAEDLTSEVFLRMVKAMVGFQIGQGTFDAWLYQIARRILYDWYRHNAAHQNVELTEQYAELASPPEETTVSRLDHQQLSQAIQALPGDQQEVLILRFINGLSLEKTAEVIHRSIDAVKGLQSRAIHKLRIDLIERGV